MRDEEPVYVAVVKAAVASGARIGELVALEWDAVSLTERKIEIRHTFDPIAGIVVAPKDNEERTVYLTPAAVTVFEEWTRSVGVRTTGLVFPAPRSGERLNADYIRKVVASAMDTADIPKVNPDSAHGAVGKRPRKPLHSLRSTYARQQLEQGKAPQWVEGNLGHSSLDLTIGVYGAWTPDAMAAEAASED
jgi:integrase